MTTAFRLPSRFDWRGELSPEDRARVEQAVLEGVRRAVGAYAGGTAPTPSAAATGATAGFDPVTGTFAIPSFGDGGAEVGVPIGAVVFEEEVLLGTRRDGDILTGGGDRIRRGAFRPLPVLKLVGNDYHYAGGSPFVETANATRALRWGAILFGAQGHVVLESKTERGHFVTVPLANPLSLADIGGFGSKVYGETGAKGEVAYTGDSGQLFPLADYDVVTVVTSDRTPLVSLEPGAVWSAGRVEEAWVANAGLDPFDVEMVGWHLLGGGVRSAKVDDETERLLVGMDRTIFAAMPWAERARYLELLIDTWTRGRQERAILEIVHATKNPAELEAIFAVLRQKGVYEQLFDDLDGRVFELLQTLGQYRGGEAPSVGYLLSLLVELNVFPATGFGPNPVRELERAVDGLLDWVVGNLEGIAFLLTEPKQIIQALPQLFEFLSIFARAQVGDPAAIRLIGMMAMQAGAAIYKAIQGAEYAEELGTPYGKRGSGSGIAGDILGRLKYALLLEILSWFVGLGELKALASGVPLGERLGAFAATLSRLGRLGKAVGTAETLGRLERVLSALAPLARVADEATLARLPALLPDHHVTQLARLAEGADLPAGASLDALRAAVKGDSELVKAVDEVGEALAVAGKLEAKAGPGGVTAEVAAGMQRLLRDAPWKHEELLNLIDDIPSGSLDEFMRALGSVRSEHLAQWGPDGFRAIAQRPKAITFLREAGSDVFEVGFGRTGRSWDNFERFLEGVELRKLELTDPADYRRYLDRLMTGEASAYEEAAGARLRTILRRGPTGDARRLVGDAVGDGGNAFNELVEAERRAVEIAADVNPQLMQRSIRSVEGGFERHADDLYTELLHAGMDRDAALRARNALIDLNLARRRVVFPEELAALAPELVAERVARLRDPRKLGTEIKRLIRELDERAAQHRAAGRTEAADRVSRRADELRQWSLGDLDYSDEARALRDMVKASARLTDVAAHGGESMLRRLWVQFIRPRARPLKVGFEEYVGILSRHFRGLHGEYEVAFRIGDNHVLLKAPDRLVTLPGTDLVAIPKGGGDLLLIDNKALSATEVDAVSALTRNLPKNIDADLADFGALAKRQQLPAEFQAAISRLEKARGEIAQQFPKLTRADLNDPIVQAEIDAILKQNGIRRVVTNAGGEVQGLSTELRQIGLELMDLDP